MELLHVAGAHTVPYPEGPREDELRRAFGDGLREQILVRLGWRCMQLLAWARASDDPHYKATCLASAARTRKALTFALKQERMSRERMSREAAP